MFFFKKAMLVCFFYLMFAQQKMKYLDKILLFLTILIVVFNLTQLNIYNFLDDENRIALICFILSLCALILILILMISKKIRDKYNS